MPKILATDKNAKLESPLDDLVRTGTLSDGSCLFHSILKAIEPKYNTAKKSEKEKIVKKLRENISDSVDINTYLSLSNGELAKIEVSQYINDLLLKFYNLTADCKPFLKEEKGFTFISNIIQKSLKPYKIITQIIDYNTLDSYKTRAFDNSVVTQYAQKWYEITTKESVIDEGLKENLKDIIDTICEAAIDSCHRKYKKKIKDCSEWANDFMYKLISDFLNIDLYIITIETGLPYNMGLGAQDNIISGKRDAVIVGSIDQSHFESIGYKTKDMEEIQRVFDPNEKVIKDIRKMLGIKK